MCSFLSAIVMKSGEILCDPEHTDSHEDLITANNIHDGIAQTGRFARIEFVPPEDKTKITDLSLWVGVLDEDEKPDWLDMESLRPRLERIVSRMFLPDDKHFVLGGCWILSESQKVTAKTARVVLYGSSQATLYGSSQATLYDSSQATLRGSSRVTLYDSSQATLYGLSQATLYGLSQATLRGSSTIKDNR